MSYSDLETERMRLRIPKDGNVHGRTIAEHTGDSFYNDNEEEDEGTLFPKGFFEGDERTIKNLIRGSLPLKVTVSLMSAEVPSRTDGLLDPDIEGQVLVSYEASKYQVIPQREGETGDKTLVGWKIRQQIRPTYVQRGQFYTREQVLGILAELGVEGDPRVDELLD